MGRIANSIEKLKLIKIIFVVIPAFIVFGLYLPLMYCAHPQPDQVFKE